MTNFTPKINVFVENDYNRNSLFKHTTIKERTSSLLKNTVKIKVQNQSFSKSTEFTKFNDIKYIYSTYFGKSILEQLCLTLVLSAWALPYCKLVSHRDVLHNWIPKNYEEKFYEFKHTSKFVCTHHQSQTTEPLPSECFDTNTVCSKSQRLKTLRLFSGILSLSDCPDN